MQETLIFHGKELPTNVGVSSIRETIERVRKMADRWTLGQYKFTINPNKYGEQATMVGDTVVMLDGTVISQPTAMKEEYKLSSIFYQNRPIIKNTVSVPNLGGIEYKNGMYYVLNNTSKTIDVYTTNFSFVKSLAIIVNPIGTENFTSFDITSTENIYAIKSDLVTDYLYKVAGATVTPIQVPSSVSGRVKGVEYDEISGNLWLITDTNTLYKTNINFTVFTTVTMPPINPAKGYRGMTMVGLNMLVISFNSDNMNGVYFVDTSNGYICNYFSLPDYADISDVTFNGTDYIFSTSVGNKLLYTNGNTLLLDIYNLENEIRSNGFLSMVDDMGVTRRVTVSDYRIERMEGSLQKYSIDISVTKVNRGIS
jgi:hypothetical protein